MTEAASTDDIRISCHVEMHGIKCWRIQLFTPAHKWEFLPGPHGYNTRAEAMAAAHEFCQDNPTLSEQSAARKQQREKRLTDAGFSRVGSSWALKIKKG